MASQMTSLITTFIVFIICAFSKKVKHCAESLQAPERARPVFVQPLSLTPFDSSPSRGASGGTVHFAGTAKASPTRRGGIASAMTERLYEGKPFLCRKVRLLASPVSFWRKEWYNGFAALPAHFMGREVKPNGVYFHIYPVRRSECSVLLHLQVA